MFILKIFDRKGIELKEKDIVKISNGRQFTFFAEVKYLEKENALAPFHTFSFHSMEKVDKVPENAVKSTEDRYDIWYLYDEDAEQDEEKEDFEKYLRDWKDCENLIDKAVFKIQRIENKRQTTLF